jgi:hypothetical protein
MHLKLSDEIFEKYYHDAVLFDPEYLDFYITKAVKLLPVWGAPAGAWHRFAEQMRKNPPSNNGNMLYAQILSSVQYTGALTNFKESGASWPFLREGYRDLIRGNPKSDWLKNRFAMLACLADDMGTAREIMSSKDFLMSKDAWTSVDIDKCRIEAKLPTSREISQNKFKKSLNNLDENVFKQLLFLAEKGDPKSMAAVGEKFHQETGVKKDEIKAYAWLHLSGIRGELANDIFRQLSPEQQIAGNKEVERIRVLLIGNNPTK